MSKGRNRDVYKYLDGKDYIVVRELETDVLDFVTNMCINSIESDKLRKLINNPMLLRQLFENKDNFDKDLEKNPISIDSKKKSHTRSRIYVPVVSNNKTIGAFKERNS